MYGGKGRAIVYLFFSACEIENPVTCTSVIWMYRKDMLKMNKILQHKNNSKQIKFRSTLTRKYKLTAYFLVGKWYICKYGLNEVVP